MCWLFAACWLHAAAPPAPPVTAAPRRPVATFSIVVRDPKTGEMGVAVQSHWFSVGSIVTWGEAGVGVVATQSFVEPAYGPKGLDLMRKGTSAPDALRMLLAQDAEREVRQVAMLDAQGRVAAHTGRQAIAAAGHHVGVQYSAQANMMANDKVFAREPQWVELVPRLPAAGLLPNDPALIARIVKLAPARK